MSRGWRRREVRWVERKFLIKTLSTTTASYRISSYANTHSVESVKEKKKGTGDFKRCYEIAVYKEIIKHLVHFYIQFFLRYTAVVYLKERSKKRVKSCKNFNKLKVSFSFASIYEKKCRKNWKIIQKPMHVFDLKLFRRIGCDFLKNKFKTKKFFKTLQK